MDVWRSLVSRGLCRQARCPLAPTCPLHYGFVAYLEVVSSSCTHSLKMRWLERLSERRSLLGLFPKGMFNKEVAELPRAC